MTDQEISDYLRDNGYPPQVWRAGRRGLLERWERFVEAVAQGYEGGLEDYRKELDIRGVLSLIGQDDAAREIDRRLAALLTGCDQRIWESGPGDPFWDFGYPRNASGELLADLQTEGLM